MAKLVELIVGKYDGSLKAEHGTGINMAPYVEREWGEKATELMWRVKQLADPDGVLDPGVVLNRDPGVHLRNLKTTPAIEESATHLRRVRLLRAGLPEPQPDHDAAPADRPAPRDGAPAGGLAAAAGAARGVRVRRARDLRRRRLLPARLPGRDRHRQAGQGTAQAEAHASAPKRGAGGGEALGRGREGLARRPAGRRPAGAPDQARRGPARGRRRAGRALARQRRVRERSRPPARRRRRRLRPLLHQPHLRPARPGARRWSRSRARAGLPVWIPERRRRQLLRAALELERLRRRPPPQGERDGRAALGAGAARGRCRS